VEHTSLSSKQTTPIEDDLISPTKKSKNPSPSSTTSSDKDIMIMASQYHLLEVLQEYEGMNLEYPHNTPDLWEGPLPVPYKKLKMPITSIMEDVFIEPHTLPSHPVEMAQEEYPDDLYMDL
jgi:hypothetical protein